MDADMYAYMHTYSIPPNYECCSFPFFNNTIFLCSYLHHHPDATSTQNTMLSKVVFQSPDLGMGVLSVQVIVESNCSNVYKVSTNAWPMVGCFSGKMIFLSSFFFTFLKILCL